MIKKVFLIVTATLALAGCVDRISTLGSSYYPDTVGFHTITRADTGFIQMRDTIRPFVSYLGQSYNLTNYSPLMIIGRVGNTVPAGTNESIVSWGLLKFNPISSDSIKMIVGLRLLLKDLNYSYGDVSNSNVDLQVWTESKNKVTDSTNFLTNPIQYSDLDPIPVGSIDTLFYDTADHVLPIRIDTSVINDLSESSLSFVITPKQSMTNARAFGTSDNGSVDASSVPELQVALNNGDTVYEAPELDEQLVKDSSSPPLQNEFTLRGGTGARERIMLDLSRTADTVHFSPFTTINNAVLILHMDVANSRESDLSFDTSGPAIVQITGIGDTAAALSAFGYHDPTDPTVIRFQIRGLIEDWLRSPVNNFGFELRSGFVTRVVPGVGGVNIGVEDNTLNRWTFYNQYYSDPSKRPQLIITYSNLH